MRWNRTIPCTLLAAALIQGCDSESPTDPEEFSAGLDPRGATIAVGQAVEIWAENRVFCRVTWSVEDPAIASVSPTEGQRTTLRGISPGETTLVALGTGCGGPGGRRESRRTVEVFGLT